MKSFDTHLQGIITHGHKFTLFRSFGNVGKGTNVAIYGWLRELEEMMTKEGKLPPELFMQIDGMFFPFSIIPPYQSCCHYYTTINTLPSHPITPHTRTHPPTPHIPPPTPTPIGGPENANAAFIAMAELLVHRGLTDRVILTRLPPGHTHEV